MSLIGLIAGIPVFFEVGFVLLFPIIAIVARQAKMLATKGWYSFGRISDDRTCDGPSTSSGICYYRIVEC